MFTAPTTIARALLLSALALHLAAPAAAAQPAKKTPAKSAAAKAPAEPDEAEPDTAGAATVDYRCELGDQVTIYTNDSDPDHIALRWKKRLHRLARVDTSTGAQRFENQRYGLVWIGIPAKGMLLDSKQGRQLANECKSPEQLKPASANVPAAPATAAERKG